MLWKAKKGLPETQHEVLTSLSSLGSAMRSSLVLSYKHVHTLLLVIENDVLGIAYALAQYRNVTVIFIDFP